MKKKLINTDKPNTTIILLGYISDPPEGGGGGGGGGFEPGYPTYPGTGGGGSGEGTDNGMGGTLPSGSISTDGQEQRGTTFFAPPITNFVRFRFRSTAPLPGWTVQTYSLGQWKSASATANPVYYKTLDVDIAASNVNVSITFQTTDTNGGTVLWQAMHR